MLFAEFSELVIFYVLGVLILTFVDTCIKLYFSQKISFKHIIECICFPIVIILVIVSLIIKTYELVKTLVLNFIYVKRAYKFLSKTQYLTDEELVDCICKNFLKKDSLDIKFFYEKDIHLE